MPITTGGSVSTHITDYYWARSGNKIVLVGRSWNDNLVSGLWYWFMYEPFAVTNIVLSARLLRYN